MQNKYLFIILIFFLLNACQTVQDGLAGNKNNNSDEFLIEKKNPLEMPPDIDDLPKPDDNAIEENKDGNFKKILKSKKTENQNKATSENSSLKESIIEKIEE